MMRFPPQRSDQSREALARTLTQNNVSIADFTLQYITYIGNGIMLCIIFFYTFAVKGETITQCICIYKLSELQSIRNQYS